jgi:hypothetical protein
MKDEKNLNSTKMDQREKTPDRQKKKNPDRGRWIFKGDKNPEHNCLRRGSKAVGPMS